MHHLVISLDDAIANFISERTRADAPTGTQRATYHVASPFAVEIAALRQGRTLSGRHLRFFDVPVRSRAFWAGEGLTPYRRARGKLYPRPCTQRRESTWSR
jgi:hypothetical protein